MNRIALFNARYFNHYQGEIAPASMQHPQKWRDPEPCPHGSTLKDTKCETCGELVAK